ncbi:MAG: DUF2567 domain-containing protein, partial [Micromonosporaceae bacterium]
PWYGPPAAGYGPPPMGFGPPPAPRPDPRPGWSNDLVAATVAMVALAVLGVVWGFLWQAIMPGPEILMTADGPVHADATSESYFAVDGWFAVLGAAVGLFGALGSWLLVRRHRGPLVLVGVVAGCLISAVVAWQVGRHIGLPEFERLITDAPVGERFHRPARLVAYGLLAVPGFTAAFTYTLLAGWSRYAGLRRPAPGEWLPAPGPGPWQAPVPPR